MQTALKMTKTLAHGYSSKSANRELSNEYQHDRVLEGFQKCLRSCSLDESKKEKLSIGRVMAKYWLESNEQQL